MSLDYVTALPDIDGMGTVRERRFGGPTAYGQFLMEDLWIPSYR